MNVALAGGAISLEHRHDESDEELRAALFEIEASAEGLRSRARMTPRQFGELTEGLVAEVHRLRAMVDDLVDAPSTFDLGAAIAPAIESARASGLEVRSRVRRGIMVEGRRDSTAQVVLALLDNARQHAAPSAVDLRASTLRDAVVLDVQDRGCGIASASRQQVFKLGVRGDDSAGSGLGLFNAQRLMAAQGGSIVARARAAGGTSFAVSFRRPSSSVTSMRRRAPLACATVL